MMTDGELRSDEKCSHSTNETSSYWLKLNFQTIKENVMLQNMLSNI